MLSALKVLWAALVGIYDETITFLGANLTWFALGLPLYLLLFLVLLPLAAVPTAAAPGLTVPLAACIAAIVLLCVPTPGAFGLAGLARRHARGDAPQWAEFWPTVRQSWREALLLFVVGACGILLLLANVFFYAVVTTGLLRLVSVIWVYALAFWLGLQQYLAPLHLQFPNTGTLDLYRRAALLALAQPLFTGVLLLAQLAIAVVGLLAVPLYPLVSGAYVSLVHAHAFRYLRRRYADEADEAEAP